MLGNKKIIVSLTSFPAAIPFAVRAVRAILEQTVLPDKVVLYLTASQFPNGEIPPELTVLANENPLFEVRCYEPDIRSYRKLIPALKDFPDDIIVTVDDDVFYNKNMLKRLLRVHKKYPDAIIGHRVRRASFDESGRLLPYARWKIYKAMRFLFLSMRPRFTNLQTGVGGVLYPPHSLPLEAMDSKMFMELAPTADDIWFWLMAVKNGTKIAPVKFGCYRINDLRKPHNITLKSVNIDSGIDVNVAVAEKILKKNPEIEERLKSEK